MANQIQGLILSSASGEKAIPESPSPFLNDAYGCDIE
jgi:hypothetical protein